MKTKTLLLSISILLVQQIFGQEYNSTAIEGAHWIVRLDYISTVYPVDELWEYYSSGDTAVGDYNYKKIFKRNLLITQSGPPFQATEPYQLFGLIRDDTTNKKVFAIQFSEDYTTCPLNEEFLLFDFSLNIGDTANLCIIPFYDFVIQNIFSSNVLGFTTRILEGPEMLYEGMGSNFGLFEEMFAPVKSQHSYIYHTFLYYYCRESPCDLLVSTNNITEPPIFEIFPNPTSQTIYIKHNHSEKINSVSIYNILGQKEFQFNGYKNQIDISTFEKGIFIIEIELNGKKLRHKIFKE